MRYVNPEALAAARGYNNGVLMTPNARGILFVAGQIGWNGDGQLVSDRFVDQFDRPLANVIAVVGAAGGTPESIALPNRFLGTVSKSDGTLQPQPIEKACSKLGNLLPR